jgi:hypothetical protein
MCNDCVYVQSIRGKPVSMKKRGVGGGGASQQVGSAVGYDDLPLSVSETVVEEQVEPIPARLHTILSKVHPSAAEFISKLDAFLALKGVETLKAGAEHLGELESESYDCFRKVFAGSTAVVVVRLKDMHKIVGAKYLPAEAGASATDVLERLVVDVVQSRDELRLLGLARLCVRCAFFSAETCTQGCYWLPRLCSV